MDDAVTPSVEDSTAASTPSMEAPKNIATLMAEAGARRRFMQKADTLKEAPASSPELDSCPLWRGHNRCGKSNPRPYVPPLKLAGSPHHSKADVGQKLGGSGPPVKLAYPYIPTGVLTDMVDWLDAVTTSEGWCEGASHRFKDSDSARSRFDMQVIDSEGLCMETTAVQGMLSALGYNLNLTVANDVDNPKIMDGGRTSCIPNHAVEKEWINEDAAATRLQAFHRGKTARKHVQNLKMHGAAYDGEYMNSVRSDLDFLALDAGQAEILPAPAVDVSRSPIPWPHGDKPLPVPLFNTARRPNHMKSSKNKILIAKTELRSVHAEANSAGSDDANRSEAAPKQIELLLKTVQACRSLPRFVGDKSLPEPIIDLYTTTFNKKGEARNYAQLTKNPTQVPEELNANELEEGEMLEATCPVNETPTSLRTSTEIDTSNDHVEAKPPDKACAAWEPEPQSDASSCQEQNGIALAEQGVPYAASSKDDEVCPRGHDLCWHAWQCIKCAKRGHGLRWGCVECPEANTCQSCDGPQLVSRPQRS